MESKFSGIRGANTEGNESHHITMEVFYKSRNFQKIVGQHTNYQGHTLHEYCDNPPPSPQNCNNSIKMCNSLLVV